MIIRGNITTVIVWWWTWKQKPTERSHFIRLLICKETFVLFSKDTKIFGPVKFSGRFSGVIFGISFCIWAIELGFDSRSEYRARSLLRVCSRKIFEFFEKRTPGLEPGISRFATRCLIRLDHWVRPNQEVWSQPSCPVRSLRSKARHLYTC